MRIAHISDVHVKWPAGRGGPWYRYLNKRVLGGLNLLLHRSHPIEIMEALVADLRGDPPDHLVVSGDLTNLAFEAEFERARGYIDAIGLPPERVSLIPGNHDTYTRGSYRERLLEAAFADYLGGPDVTWPRKQVREGVAFVSTTSCVPTPWFRAWGRMGAEQLARVGALLREESGFKVVLVHHPPLLWNGEPDRPSHGNKDGAELLRVCREGGAHMLLCGHVHRNYSYVLEGGLRIECAGSATEAPKAFGQRATYNRYLVEDGALKEHEVRAFHPTAKQFTNLRTTSLQTA